MPISGCSGPSDKPSDKTPCKSGTAGCPEKKKYKTKPTLDELLADPEVDAELKKAWKESNPDAPDVPQGTPGSLKQEQGGGIYWNKKTGELEIQRTPPGNRDGTSGAPASIGPDYEKVAEFHTHPNKASEGVYF